MFKKLFNKPAIIAALLLSLVGGAVALGNSIVENGNFFKKVGNSIEVLDPYTLGGAGIANVIEDTTPQLGGDLDLNGFNVDYPTTPNISDVLDDDTMVTATATSLATSESVKAYIDNELSVLAVPMRVNLMVKDDSESCAIGDGAGDVFYPFPSDTAGTSYNLVGVGLYSQTAGTTGLMTVQIRNVTQAADMLSTRVTVDTGEKTSLTAATPAVIDTGNDDVNKGDELRVDIDACHASASLGVTLILYFSPA